MIDYKRLTDEELADFLSRVFVQLEPTLAQLMMSCSNELLEYRSKIKNGTLMELPYLHHHKENINGLNYEFWQVVFNYKGTMLTTKAIYDKAEAEAELAKIRGQK